MLCLDAPKMIINIELKGPCDSDVHAAYPFEDVSRQTRDLIDKYQIWERTMVSSFDPQITACMQRLAKQRWIERDFMLIQLFNGDHWPKPAEMKTPKGMQGINCRVRDLEQDWIVKARDTGKKLGAWIGRNDA